MIKTIGIDAGHGGADPGAVAKGFGLREKDLTLTIARHIEWYLNNFYEVNIKMTRTKDTTLDLSSRTKMLNSWGVDYVLSIHINAGGGTGYEDFIFLNLSNDGTTAKMRDAVHNEIVPILNKYGVKNRGKKKANFHMLREPHAPAMLSENLFIDNATDQKLLANENFIIDISRAHAVGVAKALGLKAKVKEEILELPKAESLPTFEVLADGISVGNYDSMSYILRHVEKSIVSDSEVVTVRRKGTQLKVPVEYKDKSLKVDGFMIDNKNYVAIRDILEFLGFDIDYNKGVVKVK